MPFRIFNAHADRSIEWLSSLFMINWAFVLALPGNTLATSPAFSEFARYHLTEPKLAAIMGGIGCMRAAALYINGRWPRTPVLRMIGSLFSSLIWGQIACLQAMGSVAETGAISTGAGVYGLLACAEILCVYRAAFDARYARP